MWEHQASCGNIKRHVGETWLFRLFLAIMSLWEIVGCDDHVDVGKSWLFCLFLGIMSLWERVGCDDHVDFGKRLLIIELL